ncbi:hypothetical protein GCM10010191_17650 [Actinomadura vinacea]|uniref:DUF3168 domain-containing protein n=1 Tax=Actinomadura vinacea TaxID=115336 RepID=A0ABN3IN12_9ACTN
MRRTYVHVAVVAMAADGDVRAPGAAVTVAVCGHWEHPPPCPLAPHHVAAERSGDEVRLRVLFATRPEAVAEVRRRIETALRRDVLEGPDGVVTRWRFRDAGPGRLREEETAHAARLVRDGVRQADEGQ